MPVRVRERRGKVRGGKKFVVVDPRGKRHGAHRTRAGAVAQVRAINLSQLRKKGRGPPAPGGKRGR